MTVIDLDSHLREEYFLDEVFKLEGPLAEYTPKRIGDGKYQNAKFESLIEGRKDSTNSNYQHDIIYDLEANWCGGDVARRQVGGYDLEYRLKDMREEDIDRQVLFPSGIRRATLLPGELGTALARAYNDWVRRLISGYEDVYLPVAMIPAGNPPDMAGEARRAVSELGFRAVQLQPCTDSQTLDDPAFDEFYATVQDLNVPLFCHPNGAPLLDRFKSFYPMHVLGRPLNCVTGLIPMVIGGVFERFPGLRVVFFECSAEWILYWMHRMDDDYKNLQHGFAPHITTKPSDYIRRNVYVTCEADEINLSLAVKEIGSDHILMATDYPHFDSEFPHTVSSIRSRSDISATDKDRILGENAGLLLNL